jgi:hypothetical protein
MRFRMKDSLTSTPRTANAPCGDDPKKCRICEPLLQPELKLYSSCTDRIAAGRPDSRTTRIAIAPPANAKSLTAQKVADRSSPERQGEVQHSEINEPPNTRG